MPGGPHPPASVVLTWPPSNLENPVTRGPALFYLSIILPAITILIISARLWARFFVTRAPGIDDACILLSWGLAVANSVLVINANRNEGMGTHVWDVPLSRWSPLQKNQYISTWLNLFSLTLTRASILLFYRRLSVSFTCAFINATFFGIAWIIVAFPVAMTVSFALLCRPLEAYWLRNSISWLSQSENTAFTCLRDDILLPTSSTIGVVADLYTTLVPLLLIMRLRLPTSQKLGLYALFAVGFFVITTGIIRAVFLWKVFWQTYDMAWFLWDYWLWTILQIYLAIICASAPALRPLVHRFLITPLLTEIRAKPHSGAGTPDSRAQLARYAQYPGELSQTVCEEDGEAELEFITVPDEMKKSPSGDMQNELTTTTTTTLSRASTLNKTEHQGQQQQQQQRCQSTSTVGITTISSTIAMLRDMAGEDAELTVTNPDPRSPNSITTVTRGGATRTSGGFSPWPRTPDPRTPTSERGWPLSPEAVEVMRARQDSGMNV